MFIIKIVALALIVTWSMRAQPAAESFRVAAFSHLLTQCSLGSDKTTAERVQRVFSLQLGLSANEGAVLTTLVSSYSARVRQIETDGRRIHELRSKGGGSPDQHLAELRLLRSRKDAAILEFGESFLARLTRGTRARVEKLLLLTEER